MVLGAAAVGRADERVEAVLLEDDRGVGASIVDTSTTTSTK